MAMCCIAALLVGAHAMAGDDGWQLTSDHDGIQVYTRQPADSRLKAFRGVTTITLDDPYAPVAVVNDYANVPRWLHFVTSVQEIGRRGPLDRDLIFQVDLPWPVSDREALVRARAWNPAGTFDTVIRFSNAPALLPPNGDIVRFPELDARFDFHWAGGNRLVLTYELVADPGGYLPGWLVNLVLRDAPRVTLERFTKALARPEYQGRYFDYIQVPPGMGPGGR